MNLFLQAFERFSRWGLDAFAAENERRLPLRVLEQALRTNPALAGARPAVEGAAALLAERTASGEPWRDPEVYPPVTALADPALDPAAVPRHLARLRVHLGAAEPASLPDGWWRLVHSRGGVLRREGARLAPVDELVLRVDGFAPVFLLPAGGLFADLVGEALYPREAGAYDAGELAGRMRRACALLRAYSPEIADDLTRVVRTVVLTPDLGDAERWSYNLRLGYFGGVFVNPFPIDELGVVESLVHEYYHQRLWEWWAHEPLEGLPPAAATVVSPVTGRSKPAVTMVHALAVYASAEHLYRTVLETMPLEDAQRAWAAARLERLRAGVPELHRRLRAAVAPGTPAEAFVDFVAEAGAGAPA